MLGAVTYGGTNACICLLMENAALVHFATLEEADRRDHGLRDYLIMSMSNTCLRHISYLIETESAYSWKTHQYGSGRITLKARVGYELKNRDIPLPSEFVPVHTTLRVKPKRTG